MYNNNNIDMYRSTHNARARAHAHTYTRTYTHTHAHTYARASAHPPYICIYQVIQTTRVSSFSLKCNVTESQKVTKTILITNGHPK